MGALFVGTGLSLALPPVVCAKEHGVEVALTGCEGLESGIIAQVVELELQKEPLETVGEPVDLALEIVCEADGVRITADAPLTDKKLERTIPVIGPEETEPERVVALAASQLYRASWLELGAPVAAPDGPAVPAGTTGAGESAANGDGRGEVVERGEVTVGGGARLRALGELLPLAHVELRGGGSLGSGVGLYGLAAFEYGWVTRSLGTARAYGAWLGLELSKRWPVTGAVAIEAGGSVSCGYVRLVGEGAAPEIIAGAVDGLTGEVALLAGPVFSAGELFVIALDLQGGYALRNPVGTIGRGPAVSVGGFWVGAVLRIGMRIG